MICPSCQCWISAPSANCPKCQTKIAPAPLKPVVPVIPQTSVPVVPQTSPQGNIPVPVSSPPIVPNPNVTRFCCVVCANENVQRVSAICQAGNSLSHSHGTTVGVGHMFGVGTGVGVASTVTSGSTATSLALSLAPPQRPILRRTGIYVFAALLGFSAFSCATYFQNLGGAFLLIL